MRARWSWFVVLGLLLPTGASAQPVSVTVGGVHVEERPYVAGRPRAFSFVAGMTIDADGSPNAYSPDDKGIDALAHGLGGGILKDKNKQPVVQGPGMPRPGFYVSATSLFDRRFPETNPARFVNAETVPYIALPPEVMAPYTDSDGVAQGIPGGARVGCLVLVTNLLNGRSSYAIVADVGPHNQIGEGSVALAKRLDIPGTPRAGGAPAGTISYVVFPGSGSGQGVIPTNEEIDRVGAEKAAAWGGPDALVPTEAHAIIAEQPPAEASQETPTLTIPFEVPNDRWQWTAPGSASFSYDPDTGAAVVNPRDFTATARWDYPNGTFATRVVRIHVSGGQITNRQNDSKGLAFLTASGPCDVSEQRGDQRTPGDIVKGPPLRWNVMFDRGQGVATFSAGPLIWRLKLPPGTIIK